MTTGDVISLLQRTLFTMLAVGGPIVLATMVVGLVISILQAATQVNEATLTFVPKLVVVAAILLLAGPGMLEQLIDFTRYIFSTAVAVAR
jgi:flagellar biosynthetic protein FliQ